MKVFKIIIPIIIFLSIIAIDYYNKFYKENTDFDKESIFLYVIENDSLASFSHLGKMISHKPSHLFHYTNLICQAL